MVIQLQVDQVTPHQAVDSQRHREARLANQNSLGMHSGLEIFRQVRK